MGDANKTFVNEPLKNVAKICGITGYRFLRPVIGKTRTFDWCSSNQKQIKSNTLFCMRRSALDIGWKVLLRVLMDFQFFRALVQLVGEKAIWYTRKNLKKRKREKRKIKPKGFTLNWYLHKHRHFMYCIKLGKEIKTLHLKNHANSVNFNRS